jgi:hypothetical protein
VCEAEHDGARRRRLLDEVSALADYQTLAHQHADLAQQLVLRDLHELGERANAARRDGARG